jgi:hypothetical protein
MDVVVTTKRYVADDRHRLRLFDVIAAEVRRVTDVLRGDEFSTSQPWSPETLRSRIRAFDGALTGLCSAQAVIGRWGGIGSIASLTLGIQRLAEAVERKDSHNSAHWRNLQWYPPVLLFFSGGVAAVAVEKYDDLFAMMRAVVSTRYEERPFVVAATEAFGHVRDAFQMLEGLERHKSPFSEHVYETLQGPVGESLFLGSEYERAFDRFELLYAIQYAHESNRMSGPIGRFGWRGSSDDSTPLHLLMAEAKKSGDRWRPLRAGLCDGSLDAAMSIGQEFSRRLAHSRW